MGNPTRAPVMDGATPWDSDCSGVDYVALSSLSFIGIMQPIMVLLIIPWRIKLLLYGFNLDV